VAACAAACSRGAVATVALNADAAAPAHPVGTRIFVTNEASGDLSVIDAKTSSVIATVPLGKRPRGIQATADGRLLYVALSGSPVAGPGVDESTLPPPERSADGIAEIDAATLKVRRVIRSGTDPEQLAVSRDGSKLYIANEDAAQLSVVDVASGNTIARVKIGEEPEGVAVRPDGAITYVTSEGDNAVFAIDSATNQLVKRIEVGARPRSIGFLPDGSKAYVTLENDGSIAVIDSRAHTLLKHITLQGQGATPKPRPMGIAVVPDGSSVLVTTGSFGSLFFIDPATDEAIGSTRVGQRPWGVALIPGEPVAVTANGPSNDVSVVDLRNRTVITTIPVGEKPWGLAVIRDAGGPAPDTSAGSDRLRSSAPDPPGR
jgi:YVTN family beta-propeller protein